MYVYFQIYILFALHVGLPVEAPIHLYKRMFLVS